MKAEIDELFAYYCQRVGRTEKYALTEKRRRACELRLKEFVRYYKSDLQSAVAAARQAIDNLADSDWHRENNYVDWLDQIFRSFEEFEKRWTWGERRGGQMAERTDRPAQGRVSGYEDGWKRVGDSSTGIRSTSVRNRSEEVH